MAGLPLDVPVTISTSRRICKCPYCGADLESFYQQRWEEIFDRVIFEEFELPVSSDVNQEPDIKPECGGM